MLASKHTWLHALDREINIATVSTAKQNVGIGLQSKTGRCGLLLGGKAGSVAAGKWFRSWLGRRTGRWPTGGEKPEPTGYQRDSTVQLPKVWDTLYYLSRQSILMPCLSEIYVLSWSLAAHFLILTK